MPDDQALVEASGDREERDYAHLPALLRHAHAERPGGHPLCAEAAGAPVHLHHGEVFKDRDHGPEGGP